MSTFHVYMNSASRDVPAWVIGIGTALAFFVGYAVGKWL